MNRPEKKTRHEIDMIHGSIGDKILLFVLPLAVTGILQQLFNAADIAVVGRFVGKNAMAAVGSNSPVVGLLVNLFVGISVGANVVISGYTGQDNAKKIEEAVHTALLFSVLSGLFVCLLGQVIARPLLTRMGVPEEVLPMAVLYLRVYTAGAPVIFLYNFESAIFRSQGDTRTPLICLMISGVTNVILNVFFVVVLGMTVEGVALATLLSNVLSSGLLLLRLFKYDGMIRVSLKRLRIVKDVFRQMLLIGLPAGLQGMVFSVSNIVIQSAVNSLGADVMAASSAAFNIEIFAYYILNAFGQASTTFVGQNYGAGSTDRCRRSVRLALLQGMAATVIIVILILSAGNFLLGFFTDDPSVIALGMIRLRYIVAGEFLNTFMEVISGAMRGYGNSAAPALMTFIGVCGTRITWVFLVFSRIRTLGSLMIIYPISWAVTCIALFFAYRRQMKKLDRGVIIE